MSKDKQKDGLSLTVFFEDEKLKQCFIEFFEKHAPSVEQFLEVTYATEGFGDSDPRIVIGKNSLGIERFNKSRGLVMTLEGISDYSEVGEGQLFSEIDRAHGMVIMEKGSLGVKDRRIGMGGSLSVIIQKMVEIESSKEGLDVAIAAAKGETNV